MRKTEVVPGQKIFADITDVNNVKLFSAVDTDDLYVRHFGLGGQTIVQVEDFPVLQDSEKWKWDGEKVITGGTGIFAALRDFLGI